MSTTYDLYAVSCHSGSMSGGHYISYCKNPILDTWYEFNDLNVKQISKHTSLVTKAAYVLFYKRRE